MKGAVFVFSNDGCFVADIINRKLGFDIFVSSAVERGTYKKIKGRLTDFLGTLLSEKYEAFVFVSACGIAVRSIAPHILDKTVDPAVVVVDCYGKKVISLLSGHLGGANNLTKSIAKMIQGQAIITTASDQKGVSSVDVIAMRLDCHIESMEKAKDITSMLVNEKKVAILSSILLPEDLSKKGLTIIEDIRSSSKYQGLILVNQPQIIPIDTPHVKLTPRYYAIGIGCRKDMDYKVVEDCLQRFLSLNKIDKCRIKKIATIEKKANEQAIIKLAKELNIPMEIVDQEKILAIEERFSRSDFVKNTVGVSSVAEPCAHLSSGGGQILGARFAYKGVTMAAGIFELRGDAN